MTSTSDSSQGRTTGIIIGIVIGAIVFLLLLLALFQYFSKKVHKVQAETDDYGSEV